ncbi:hypothetical protein M7I_8126 [Glarea lozoyensis 74030]|uniref:Uncharacterized protein n=1 Tax=Glarea lozoyensis (strain ATCC 74030 / MF5533) TaxID=1104152 RepID=H0EZ64_GLAL7|nr:hypothetical protein M7I_8126 [Glarea lozoyensis 74030]
MHLNIGATQTLGAIAVTVLPFTNPALLQVNRKIRAELQKKFTLLTLRVGEDKKKFPDHDVDLMAYFDYKCDNVSFLEACYSRQLVDCGPTAAETPLTEFEKHVQHITIRRQTRFFQGVNLSGQSHFPAPETHTA